jgi:hypothetical protein
LHNASPELQLAPDHAISCVIRVACYMLPVRTTKLMSPLLKTLGAVASRAWLDARGIDPRDEIGWFVEVELRADDPSARFELNLYPEEWGFVFRLHKRWSSIRITDLPFVHGLDELKLLDHTPRLDQLAAFLTKLENDHTFRFDHDGATVRTNLDEGATTAAVRTWLNSR